MDVARVNKQAGTAGFRLLCACGAETQLADALEVGVDTKLAETGCNGVSCDYYGCEGVCGSRVDRSDVLVRLTCSGCERITEVHHAKVAA